MSRLLLFSPLLLAGVLPVSAAISVTGDGFTYSQSFDDLTRSGTAEAWVNDSNAPSSVNSSRLVGLNGWYAGNFGTTTVPIEIRATAGASSVGSLYSFGASGAADRALGTLPLDSTASGSMRIGVRFVNNTGGTITGFTFSYTGEQWRKAQLTTATNNQYAVSYAVFDAGAGSLDNLGAYSSEISSATFNTPVDGGDNASSALDGNAIANRITGLGATIGDLTVAPGEEIWLRWFDSNSPGADHGIAIDDFSISFVAIPEPEAALLGGLGLLSLVTRRRRI